MDRLSDVGDLITNTFAAGDASDYIDESRVNAIVDSVKKHIRQVEELAMGHTQAETRSTDDDVEENAAESYGAK